MLRFSCGVWMQWLDQMPALWTAGGRACALNNLQSRYPVQAATPRVRQAWTCPQVRGHLMVPTLLEKLVEFVALWPARTWPPPCRP